MNLREIVKHNIVEIKNLSKNEWIIADKKERILKEKIESIGTPLKEWDIKIFRGIITGLDEVFIIPHNKKQEILNNCKTEEERERTEKLFKRILRGKDIKRYYYTWNKTYLLFLPFGFTDKNKGIMKAEEYMFTFYPAIMNYLSVFKEKAEKRPTKGTYYWEIRSCAFYPELEKEKILIQEINRKNDLTIDNDNFYVAHTIIFITGNKLKYILGVLNSILIQKLFTRWYLVELENTSRWLKTRIVNIPIPLPNAHNLEMVLKIESLVEEILRIKKENPNNNTSLLEKEVDNLVYKIYNLTSEEISFVEKLQS